MKNTLLVYKLLKQRKDGTLGPLFINRKQRLPINKWLQAEEHRTKGYAFRPGWHATEQPKAPHLSLKDRVWAIVEISEFERFKRPEHQGCMWYIAQNMKIIKVLE